MKKYKSIKMLIVIALIIFSISTISFGFEGNIQIQEKEIIKSTETPIIFEEEGKRIVEDKQYNIKYYEVDREGEVLKYDYNTNELIGKNSNIVIEAKGNNLTKEEAKQRIQKLYLEEGLNPEYELSKLEFNEEENFGEAKYEKKYDGIFNKYEGIKLYYNQEEDKITDFRKFSEKPTTKFENVTKEYLKENKEKYLKLIKESLNIKENENIEFDIEGAVKSFEKANTLFRKETEIGEGKEVRKVWKVTIFENANVFIDIETAEIIGMEYVKYAEALVSSAGFWNKLDESSVNEMAKVFTKLGYKTFSRYDDATDYILKDWIHRLDSQYGFYISTHGGVENGQVMFKTKDEKYWYPKDIKGNWDFVFIDACHSMANETLANAFKIYSGSKKKAYLGWKKSVHIKNANKFVKRFAARIKTAPIQKIARDVAIEMTEDVPIRFVGDKGWYGYAR